jgi:hypothetical protein
VVERVLAWLTRFRRLRVRYEWREDVHLAFRLGRARCSACKHSNDDQFC